MADKYLIREMLNKLLNDLSSIERKIDGKDEVAVQARYEVFQAEASHVLGMVLAADSPLRTLLDKYRSVPLAAQSGTLASLSAQQYPPADGSNPLVVLRGIIEAAKRLNEARGNEDSNPTLAEDVERILSRNFAKRPMVLVPVALLVAAAGFAIYGDIHFRDLRINVLEDINKKAEEAKSDVLQRQKEAIQAVNALQANVAATSIEAGKLKADIATARQNVADLTANAVRELTAQQAATINNATAAATNAVAAAGAGAARRINDSADQAVSDAKARVAPAFDKAIGKAASDVADIQDKLTKAQSHTDALNAALRAITDPTHTWTHRLADYFDLTVATVYALIAVLVILTAINLTLALLRRNG